MLNYTQFISVGQKKACKLDETCDVCIASDFRETLFFVKIYAVKVEGVVYVIMCILSLFILSKLYACLAVRAC